MGRNRNRDDDDDKRTGREDGDPPEDDDSDDVTSRDDDDDSDDDDGDNDGGEVEVRDDGTVVIDGEEFKPQSLVKTLGAVRSELKNARDELKNYKKQDRDRERADNDEVTNLKSDLEERTEELTTLKTENEKLTSQIRRSAFIERSGFDNKIARRAWKDLDEIQAELEYNDQNQPTQKSMKRVLKELAEFDADQYGTPGVDADRRGDDGDDTERAEDMNAWMRSQLGR